MISRRILLAAALGHRTIAYRAGASAREKFVLEVRGMV